MFRWKGAQNGRRKANIAWTSDAITRKLICYLYSRREESRATKEFLKLIFEILPDEVRGITIDFTRGKCFVKLVRKTIPDALYQVCKVHFLRYLNFQLPKKRKSKHYWRNVIFRATAKAIFKAPTRDKAEALLSRLLAHKSFFMASHHKRFVRSLDKNINLLLAYRRIPDLPSNSNRIEAWNRRLERKLKNMDGIQTDESCKAFP